MNNELKDAIIKAVQENKDEFQLTNWITGQFSEYIYNNNGEYIMGGEKVVQFINDFIELYTNE